MSRATLQDEPAPRGVLPLAARNSELGQRVNKEGGRKRWKNGKAFEDFCLLVRLFLVFLSFFLWFRLLQSCPSCSSCSFSSPYLSISGSLSPCPLPPVPQSRFFHCLDCNLHKGTREREGRWGRGGAEEEREEGERENTRGGERENTRGGKRERRRGEENTKFRDPLPFPLPLEEPHFFAPCRI